MIGWGQGRDGKEGRRRDTPLTPVPESPQRVPVRPGLPGPQTNSWLALDFPLPTSRPPAHPVGSGFQTDPRPDPPPRRPAGPQAAVPSLSQICAASSLRAPRWPPLPWSLLSLRQPVGSKCRSDHVTPRSANIPPLPTRLSRQSDWGHGVPPTCLNSDLTLVAFPLVLSVPATPGDWPFLGRVRPPVFSPVLRAPLPAGPCPSLPLLPSLSPRPPSTALPGPARIFPSYFFIKGVCVRCRSLYFHIYVFTLLCLTVSRGCRLWAGSAVWFSSFAAVPHHEQPQTERSHRTNVCRTRE